MAVSYRPITAAQVDGVSTGNPGDPVVASVTASGGTLHFTVTIRRGDEGVQDQPGTQGPPFANAVIDAVNTLPAGSAATVSVSFDGTDVHFASGIPQGAEGTQGPPCEVTNAQLATAISMAVAGTSNNTNVVPTLDTPFTNDPASLADMETMRAAYNALVLVLRRQGGKERGHLCPLHLATADKSVRAPFGPAVSLPLTELAGARAMPCR